MKKLILSFIVLCFSANIWAQFYHGDLFYMITSHVEPYTVEVVHQPTYSELTTVNIPDTITHEGITYNVTSIGSECFYNYTGLSSVTLGNNIKVIKTDAFGACHNISSMILGNNVEIIEAGAFWGCGRIPSIVLGNNVKSIGRGAFSACEKLSSINIPDSVSYIGIGAFDGTSLYNNPKNWENNLLYIDNCLITSDQYVYGNLEIREGTRLIAEMACQNREYVTSVTIPSSVTIIGEYAFWGLPMLTSIVWNAKNYQGCPFIGYESITSVTFGDSVEIIPISFCQGMRNLKSVKIGNSVKSIGIDAFNRCSSLTSITLPNSVTSIGEIAFEDCSSLTSITIPNTVTSIGQHAFRRCSSLKSVTLSASSFHEFCQGKGNYLLYSAGVDLATRTIQINNQEVTEFIVPNSVTRIGELAFYGCISLTSLTIGEKVNYIGHSFVDRCSLLKLIDCKSTTPPNFDPSIDMTEMFRYCPRDLIVHVPCGATAAYKNHQHWSYFGDRIKEPESIYTIDVYSQDSNKGYVVVNQNSICSGAQITAIPHEGYSFIQWTDGNTDNPRRFEITRDTTFTAVFDQIFKGQCGDSLYWHYALNTLTITGTGAMWDNRPWGSVVNEIEHVSLPTGLTYIGDDAFQDCLGLHNIDIPGTVNSIGDYSFNGCRNLTAINCYPLLPPYAETTSFSNYSAQLNAPCDSLEAYKYDMVFGQFRNFECIGSESTTTDGVSIEPTSNTATVTWPTEEGAETYTIEIMNGDEVFCLLTFNADGMLLNIAFAPSRNGNHHPAQYAEQTTNGLRFTITNLHEGTLYGYDITAKDEEDQTLSTYSGEFTTESLTAVENIILPDNNTHKILHNGQLLIIRDGKTYNVMGQEL